MILMMWLSMKARRTMRFRRSIKRKIKDWPILLIWSDGFELATLNKKVLAEKITRYFENSIFEEVFFMMFINNLPMFIKSLELWALRGSRVPMKEVSIRFFVTLNKCQHPRCKPK
jgi:hypothetical protein